VSGVDAIKCAIDVGFRLFDTAFLYGNEDIVGQAITEKIAEGVVTRDEMFIVGKLWGIHHDQVERACRESCRRLSLDYVDVYLLHFPVSFVYRGDEEKWPRSNDDIIDKDFMDVWREMEKLIELGLARSIGVSNFSAHQLRRLHAEASIKPAYHEMEFHPAFCRFDLLNVCRDLSINVLAFCPLGRHKPEKREPEFLYDKKLQEIAVKHGKSPAQIALRFAIQCGTIPIPKSATKTRLETNIDVFDFELDVGEMNYLKTFHSKETQICKFDFAKSARHYPF
jgi:aldehyde reductase